MSIRCLPGPRACLLSTATALALCAAPAVAQEARETVFQMLGRIIFGTGTAKVAIDTPQAVTALEQEDLDRKQAGNIGEMLKGIPGVQAAGASARPMGMAFNIRGIGNSEQTASEERIKIVVDGAPKFFEQYRMGSFFGDLELFKRVEILRGPASSTLYGSGSIGGAVVFTTKDAADYLGEGETSALRFKLGYESNGDVVKPGVIYAHRAGNADFLLALNSSHGGEKKDGADTVISGTEHKSVSGLVKGRLTFGNDGDQSLTLSLARTDTNLTQAAVAQTGGAANIPTFGFADIHAVDDSATLTWRNEFAANDLLDLTVQLSHTNTDVTKSNFSNGAFCSPGRFQVLCPGEFSYPTTALKIENTADLSTGAWTNYLTFGVQLSHQERKATSSVGAFGFHPEGTDRKLGVYAQGEFVWNDRLTLIPGLRIDFGDRTPSAYTVTLGGESATDEAISPKLSALYKLNENWGIFGTVARTERMPTLDELYSTDGALPSLNLKKESADSIELGVAYKREGLFADDDSLNVKATVFHSDLTNMIASNSATGAVPRYLNLRSAEIWGGEIEAAYDAERWFASLGYSNVKSAYRDMPDPAANGLTMTDTPAENVALTLGAKFPDKGLVVGWTAYYYDAVTTYSATAVVSGPVVLPAGTPTHTPHYDTHDLFVTWKPEDGALAGMDVTLTVENVFDADYKNNLSLDRAQGMNAKLTIGKNFTW